ncbi:pilus assembly protein TadG-related protein [Terrabacter sp. LjRoot27]|uniref:TadE/TadG family type IV pilus assembly protein n=1 Tax=Terrabacter sp. LjRoot27 TaxID=3342306 RepID=UPI003ECCEDFE
MQRRRAARDRGAVTALVAILFSTGVIIAMMALVVDVGSMMWERRQLQNGADAATLALAQDCATQRATCDPAAPGLKQLVDANAADGFGGIQRVCAVGTFPSAGAFTPCTATTGALTDCLPAPAGATGPYVEVRTRTSTNLADTGTILKPFFAQAMGWNGSTIAACSRVGWSGGHPSTVLPVVQSQCAWDDATTNGTDFPLPPPYALTGSGTPAVNPLPRVPVAGRYISKVLLQTKNEKVDGTKKCGSSGPGQYTPGNFGWLDSTGKKTCSVDLTSDKGTISASGKPGTSVPSGCGPVLQASVGSIVYIPIFTSVDGRGANTEYTIDGVSAFYLAGFHVTGNSDTDGFTPTDPSGNGTESCSGEKNCLWGWFVSPVIPVDAVPNTGTDRGPKRLSTIG